MKKILILTAFAVLAIGCRATESAGTKTPNAPATNAPANTASAPVKEEVYTKGADPRADLISAAQKRQKLPFWSATVTTEPNVGMSTEMKYSAPESYQFKVGEKGVIVIGKDSYSNEEGTWKKADQDFSESIREQIAVAINQGARGLKDVQILGTEKVGGQDATVYFYRAGDLSTKVWIEKESGLELKNEVEADSDELGKQKQTTVYDYVTPVKIEAPKID